MKKILFLAMTVCCLILGGYTISFAAKKSEAGKMSNADKVVKFLQDAKVFYIATIDGDQPRVRPFGVALNINGKVSICTGAFKNVYKQIAANSKVEISAMTPDNRWIRLSGSLINVTTEENQQKFFAASDGLDKLYSGDKRKDFTILSFQNAIAIIESFDGYKETIELK
ncbi:MAG: pyridoxamine 5'-phosphate oxidase family protein [Endomicrobium sp.]|jgi:uncharacterized pyridoxamine 5'-phosphate oxidase family protein|nr:pyridoxamine 5'-phosphate oxidase family protein [Endomicrobium sp.]